ncbi:uncharacterized protein LOC109819681 isoform X2 [Asparagus officinalis]|uniref:uncharacterized protein LOC109819681 isoform X2 n=1 Tax=Asparagus officinalis TaxID=4686 RepID=UPI00098E5414|nr:uncharacterized protein LOC109819681 isoform X2 [Asparagus officinalis]
MDPKPIDPGSAGGGDADEFTIARKRSRRVSFAETTAVHVFDRDEDFETPPETKSEGWNVGSGELGLGGDQFQFGSDDSRGSAREDEDEDEDDDGEQERFIRDMDSSSPGSGFGSVTSNDDDNFFGPVSTSFIKSGRLSEAGMSEDNNHDITLDSTAFSLHFQNVVPPDDRSANSAGSFRTPTGESVPTDFGGFVISKGCKEDVRQSKFFDGKMSDSAGVGDSSNMSLVVEDPESYDHYGKMSPTLEALLAAANEHMQSNSPFSGSGTRKSRHDNIVPAVIEDCAKDEMHIHRVNLTGIADDACFDSDLPEGHSVGTDGEQNGNVTPSHNTVSRIPIEASNAKAQVTFTPKSDGYSKGVYEQIQSVAGSKDLQNTDTLSPPNIKSQNSLTLTSGQLHLELFRDQVNGNKHSLDPSVHSMPILPTLMNLNDQQQLLSENGMQTPQNALQPLESPFPGSVSSLRSKRQQLFLDPSILSRNRLIHTPDKEESLSSLKMKLIQHGDRISAIKIPKSIIHKSPVIGGSRLRLSEKDPTPHELEGTLEKNNDDGYGAGMSVNNKKDSPKGDKGSAKSIGIQLNYSVSPTKSNVSALINLEKNDLVGSVKLSKGISSDQLSQRETNGKENLFSLDNHTERVPALDVHDSSVRHMTVKESSQILDTPNANISSPIVMFGDKLSASHGGYLSPAVYGTSNSSFSLERNKLQSSKSFSGPNSVKVRKLQIPQELEKLQGQTEGPRNHHLGNQDESTVMQKHLVNMEDNLSVGNTISTSEPPSEGAGKLQASVNVSTQFLAEVTLQSPKSKTDGDSNMPTSISPKEPLPNKSTLDPILRDKDLHCQDSQSAQESHSVQTGLYKKKRGIEQILVTDEDHLSEVSRIQKSPKVLPDERSNSRVSLGHDVKCIGSPVVNGGQGPGKHWSDIFSKVSEATKQPFSSSISKLSSVELDILEDILGEVQIAKKYQRFYTSVKNLSCSGDDHKKRVAEARSLLDKLVYQKAKLQLKKMKLDDLSNKKQLCKLKIQECANLKSTYSQFCILDARTVQHRESQAPCGNSSYTRNQVECDRVPSLKQELEMLDQKVKDMMKGFQSSCKIKGNPSCDGIIKVVNDHIDMKNCCRLIQQDLQLWKLSDVVKENDQYDIVLNYCNVLLQRFRIYSREVSSIVANNLLNNASIEKNFPNMNACLAFEFILKAKGDHAVAKQKLLSQEILETNLLLGTLLDVLEEVLVSRVQLWNLISSTFHLRSCQLDLQLSFLGFKSGRKITLSLELTSLNCATYPSKPSDLQIRILEAEPKVPSKISDEIMGVAESLESGRSMIVRLCQSVSKVVLDSDGS